MSEEMISPGMFETLGERRMRVPLSAVMPASLARFFTRDDARERHFSDYIRNLVMLLQASPQGRALCDFASEEGVSAGVDPLLEPNASFYYASASHFDLGYQADFQQKTEKGVSRYLVSFISGLRQAWHHKKGNAADIMLRPEEFLRIHRACEADTEALTHLIAWDMRAAGNSFFWRHLLSSPASDIALAFERVAEENPQHLFDGAAIKTAFNQWYADRDRINACDHAALEILDLALLHNDVPARACSMNAGDGRVAAIGKLPAGPGYLSGCTLSGVWYEGLDDDFNRAHLAQITQDLLFQRTEIKEKIF